MYVNDVLKAFVVVVLTEENVVADGSVLDPGCLGSVGCCSSKDDRAGFALHLADQSLKKGRLQSEGGKKVSI